MGTPGLISVIIPVYNVEQFLRECIDSVLQQNYRLLEVILVNDGSTDQSGRICDDYADCDARVKVIHKANGGLSSARNAGMAVATGEYIYFLDSDDWIIPNALEKLKEKADTEAADFVFFDADSFLDPPGKNSIEQRYHRKHEYKPNDGISMLTELCANGEYHSSVPLLFMRNDFLKKHRFSFPEGIIYEDMVFTYMLYSLAEKVSYLPEAFYQRRYRAASIMTSPKKTRNFVSVRTVYSLVRDFTEQHGLFQCQVAKDYVARCAANALNIYRSLDKNEQKKCHDDYKKLKNDIRNNNAFNDTSLLMKTYGEIPWFLYKVYEKSLRNIFGRCRP